jgi:cytochrome c oxidase subunit II
MSISRVSAILFVIWALTSWWIIVTPISGVLPEATNHAVDIDMLFKVMSVAGMAVFLIVQGFLLYFALQYRRRSTDAPDAIGSDIHGNTRLEIVWSVIPAVFLIVLTALSYKVYAEIVAPHKNSFVINVTAAQFAWTCEYPEYNISETKSCHMPEGEQVTVNLHALDVIHSFWVPEFRVKQDAVPGYPTRMHFIPTKVGVYRLICSEFCGYLHYDMTATLTVLSQADFKTWALQQQKGALAPIGTVSFNKDIEKIFNAHCSSCHIAARLGGLNLSAYAGLSAGGNAPGVPAGSIFKPGDHKDSTIWKIIQPGTGQPGGARMPLGGPYLSAHEIDTIAAWIDQGGKNN